jgi:hypothetical protein
MALAVQGGGEEDMRFGITRCGFKYGASEIVRQISDEKRGWVVMDIKTQRADIQIYVTKTGKVRLFNNKTRKEYKEVGE